MPESSRVAYQDIACVRRRHVPGDQRACVYPRKLLRRISQQEKLVSCGIVGHTCLGQCDVDEVNG